jgi:hypothetical protein
MPQRPPRQRLSSNALGVSCAIDDEKPTCRYLYRVTASQSLRKDEHANSQQTLRRKV